MKHITSRDNVLYKELKHLALSANARQKAQVTLLDGIHLCQSYLQHFGQPQWCVVSASALVHPQVATLLPNVERVILLDDKLYQHLSQVEHGIGVLFVIALPHPTLPKHLNDTAVMLDHLQDPGNMGSILRSAAAAGIRHIFCSKGCVAAWSPKVMRAGMGAHFLVTIYEDVDLAQVLASASLPVFATSSHAKQSVYDCDLAKPLIWLLGHEGQGVSDELMRCASEHVAIPHSGQMESLNVAASAAVCFFEQLRQVRCQRTDVRRQMIKSKN